MTAADFIAIVQEVYEDAAVADTHLKGDGVRVEALERVANRLGDALCEIEREPWARV